MSVVKLEAKKLHFYCEGCQNVKQLPVKELECYQDDIGGFAIRTPKCKCKSTLFIIPRTDKDKKVTKASHLRRVLAYRYLNSGMHKDAITDGDAKRHMAKIEKFYTDDVSDKEDLTNKRVIEGNPAPTE